jgi:cation transport ATPase
LPELSHGDRPSGRSESQHGMTADPRTVLTIIYAALTAGVGVLAVIFYVLGPVAGSMLDRSAYRWIWLAVAVVCTIGAGVVRGRASSMPPELRSLLPAAVVAWSLAEAQALLAGVGFFLTGDLLLLVAGLVLFIFLMGRHRPTVFLSRS